ncbi:phytanoyl-CoA dioxygenase family protein [Dyella subtropica]|uniref:phytanoyl-CoA dioxygenase family protein n=1 Tax=Dyella subtropica TaxID=2992127 RepID=UPI0022558122|nr:phytanoyl-CoA dioxygenase family protein [Dyella subtropica]
MKFEDDGFTILSEVVSPDACDELIKAISDRDSSKPGSRDLLGNQVVAHTAGVLHRKLLGLGLLDERHRAVQCSLFAKGDGVSWSVTPHQDLSIPVADRVDIPGWAGWSRKENVWFAQPPTAFLEDLVAVRLQLDGNASETGPLEVVPGSHAKGRLASASVSKYAEQRIKCLVPRGGALVMRPLLIHSSSKPRSPSPRRILHFLYGPSLPTGLCWASPESM